MIHARAPNIVFNLKVPVLGICYGMQTMAVQLGGEANKSKKPEFGFAKIRARNHSKLLMDINDEINSEGHGLLRCVDESWDRSYKIAKRL